jgi:hypothetical protein
MGDQWRTVNCSTEKRSDLLLQVLHLKAQGPLPRRKPNLVVKGSLESKIKASARMLGDKDVVLDWVALFLAGIAS